MANPSSTSSKRLVGLGLGLSGIRNSPPAQVAAQIKSVLSHNNPRTSPTAFSPTTSTSPTNSGLGLGSAASTICAVTNPSAVCTSVATTNPTAAQGAGVGVGAARRAGKLGGLGSPLMESFTPSMAGCGIPVASTSYQELGGVAEQLARLDLGATRDGDMSESGGEGEDVNDDGGIVEESRPYSSGPQTDPRLERQRQSPCSTRSSRAFFDVPFPLHPEKTFRIHTTPLIGSPLATSVTTAPVPSLATSPTVTTGIGESGSVSSLSVSISRSRIGGSGATNSANVQPRPSPGLRSTPRTYSPSNEDKYTSPSQSPSRSMSRVRWSKEDNYSTICSPSSSPLLGRGRSGMSSFSPGDDRDAGYDSSYSPSASSGSGCGLLSPRFSPGVRLSGSGFPARSPGSPVAKIETVLGPRERGIGCMPERREYDCRYSRLKQIMTPGSLAPLEENEGSGSYPHSPGPGLMPGENTDNTRINGDLGVDARPGLAVDITGTDSSVLHTCTRAPPPPGLPVPVSTTIPMPHAPLFNSRSDARTLGGAGVAPVRSVGFGGAVVVRRRAVGLGSPLANCVATFESLLHLRSGEDVCDGDGNNDGSSVLDASESEVETQEEEDVDADEETMSPVLMRAKDSLLLKDVRKRKRNHTDAVVGSCSTMGVEDAPAPTSAFGSGTLQLTTIEAETQSLFPSTSPSFPFPKQVCQLPSQIITTTSPTDPSPQFPAQISIPSTPTIGPSVKEQLDEDAISPLQLTGPTVPLMAVVRDSAGRALSISLGSFDLRMHEGARRSAFA